MSIVKFIKNGQIQKCNLISVNKNIIDITLTEKVNDVVLISGLQILNENNGNVQGEYIGYSTIYRTFDDNSLRYMLSNNYTIYVEPEPVPEPEPYIPTLEEVKHIKLEEISAFCKQSIINGVYIDIDGVDECFSYTIEDQSNIDDLFQLAISTGLSQPYHCDGGDCQLYTVEQIGELYFAQKLNKAHHTTYHNQLRSYILSLETIEELQNIVYGTELAGTYLETYNMMMEQSQLIIKTAMSRQVSN